jgi:8-oxo-dGTP pyrophosphatase MutT (NUDIX family)
MKEQDRNLGTVRAMIAKRKTAWAATRASTWNTTWTKALRRAWRSIAYDMLPLLLRRPRHLQVAALCYRMVGGEKQVLLVTSRRSGRWVLPKGWPIDGKSASEAALTEAWEEAGVEAAEPKAQLLGRYPYRKKFGNGLSVPSEALVFAIPVARLAETYPEAAQRQRRWFTAADAAKHMREPELKAILRAF